MPYIDIASFPVKFPCTQCIIVTHTHTTLGAPSTADSAHHHAHSDNGSVFLFVSCFCGIFVSYFIYGLLQEKMYVHSSCQNDYVTKGTLLIKFDDELFSTRQRYQFVEGDSSNEYEYNCLACVLKCINVDTVDHEALLCYILYYDLSTLTHTHKHTLTHQNQG